MKIKLKLIISSIIAINLIFNVSVVQNITSLALNNTTSVELEGVDRWASREPMPTQRNSLTSSVVNEKIYCIGGENNNQMLNSVEVYDPLVNKWETKAPMPTKRKYLISEVVDGKIYCIGGYNGSTYLNKVEVYDPLKDVWETKANMPTPRGEFSSAVIDGKIYCIGGYNTSGYLNKVEVYNPFTDKWETKANMPTKRKALVSESIGNKIYSIGGHTNVNGNYVYTKALEVYDFETNKWESKTSPLTARGYCTSNVLNGNIYIIGGTPNGGTRLKTVDVYNPINNTVQTKSPISTPATSLTSAVAYGKLYVIGGYSQDGYLNNIEKYFLDISSKDYEIEEALINAEYTKDIANIEKARSLINQLSESTFKNILQKRLNSTDSDLSLELKSATTNLDLYIKSENMISMNLSTNNVSFDNYSGVEDLELSNAIGITVNSSLPYQLNSYLMTEIQNVNNLNTIDKSLFKIRDNTEQEYKSFLDINEKLILKDNCESGNDKSHSIDLKLQGGNAHISDIYKTVIKFEAEQK